MPSRPDELSEHTALTTLGLAGHTAKLTLCTSLNDVDAFHVMPPSTERMICADVSVYMDPYTIEVSEGLYNICLKLPLNTFVQVVPLLCVLYMPLFVPNIIEVVSSGLMSKEWAEI